jgi:hypothetical protein
MIEKSDFSNVCEGQVRRGDEVGTYTVLAVGEEKAFIRAPGGEDARGLDEVRTDFMLQHESGADIDSDNLQILF